MCSIVIILFSCISSLVSTPAPTHLLVTRVGPCYDDQEYKVAVSELSVTTQTYDSSLSGTLNISQDISNGWMIMITIEKCLDIRNIDSCDHFKSYFVIKQGCNGIDENEQDIYGLLFYYTKPQLECPVRAGKYSIISYPFFTEDNYLAVHESKISTSVFGYIYRLNGYTVDKHKILCVEAILQLRYIRNHNWTYIKNVEITTLGTVNSKEDKKIDEEY